LKILVAAPCVFAIYDGWNTRSDIVVGYRKEYYDCSDAFDNVIHLPQYTGLSLGNRSIEGGRYLAS
jgi:hypothetical protein